MEPSGITPQQVADVAYTAIRECATTLRPDFLDAVRDSYGQSLKADPDATQTDVLRNILKNAEIGRDQCAPICQDTGSVWVCLEIGEESFVPGNVFSLLDDAVARAYADGALRMSMVRDALLDRSNTQDNTPAFTDIHIVPGKAVRMHVLLKGGGSDNASRVLMLPPASGWDGIKAEVLKCVREKAASACPPLLIGLGIGGTFDKVAGLAKTSLLRRVGDAPADPRLAPFEKELLDEVNGTDIGPGALGGACTAVAVHISTAPCHIAALPLAINMGCCAMRSAAYTLMDDDGRVLEPPPSPCTER